MKNITHWLTSLTAAQRRELSWLSAFGFLFSLGQLLRIETGVGGLYAHDIITAAWILSHSQVMRTVLLGLLSRLRRHPLYWVTLIWIAIGVLLHQINSLDVRPLLVLGRLTMYGLFAGGMGYVWREKPVLLRAALVVIGNSMLWLGALQYILLPDTRFLATQGWDDHYFRLVGPLFDPNFMGILIILTALYTLSLARFLSKRSLIAYAMYYCALLALTFSRASFATAALAGGLIAGTPQPLTSWNFSRRVLLVFLCISAFVFTISVAPRPGGEGVNLMRTASITARQSTAIQTYRSLTPQALFLGNGLFTSPDYAQQSLSSEKVPNHARVPDNVLLLLLSGTGIVGTILLISCGIYLIGKIGKTDTAGAIALGAVVAHAQFNNTLFEPFINVFLLLGICCPLPETMEKKSTNSFRVKKRRSTRPGTRS